MNTIDFDQVVVGGSPALVARATHLARLGDRVALIESHHELGGSWRLVAPFGDGRRYDCFEHYLAGGNACKSLLSECGLALRQRPMKIMYPEGLSDEEKALVTDIYKPEVPLETMDGSPLLLPYTEGNFVRLHRRGTLEPEDMQELRQRMLREDWRAARRRNDINQYFAINMDDLILPLERVARESGVTIMKSHRVGSVVVSRGFAQVDGTFGALTTRRVLLGKYFEGAISCEDRPLAFTRIPDQRLTLLFRVHSQTPQPHDYVKFVNWRSCHAIQNVSAPDEEPGRTAFGLHVHPLAAADRTVEEVMTDLRQVGILNSDSRLIDHHWFPHHFNGGLREIAGALPYLTYGRVEALIFTNMGQEIGGNPEIWKAALLSANAIAAQ